MKVIIFDTETTSLEKPFCYDLGYCILDTDSMLVIEEKFFIIKQNWYNFPLFESAYYKEKRPLYIPLMRARKATLNKWGYVMQTIARDIKKYEITDAYAYNSDFDDKVINFNCDWFKCINPFETVAIHDIWGYASQFITNTQEYKDFCEKNGRFTDTGNYKGSAEIVFQYITNNPDFTEAHMGLYDAQIETAILVNCLDNGAVLNTDYKVNKILPRPVGHPFTVKVDGTELYSGEYIKKYVRDGIYSFTTTIPGGT